MADGLVNGYGIESLIDWLPAWLTQELFHEISFRERCKGAIRRAPLVKLKIRLCRQLRKNGTM